MKILMFVMMMVCGLSMAAAEEWFSARVEFSDRTAEEGRVAIMGARPLTFNPGGLNYQRKILLSDVQSIDQVVESQTMNRPWAYKENGKNDREYFDGQYPFINFMTVITLTSGEVLKGHIVSLPMRLETEKAKKKLFLPRQIKGEIGQTMEQMIYPTRIVFQHAQATAPDIVVKLSGVGKTITVAALDCRRENVYFAKGEADGIYRFAKLLPGGYDLFILTDTYALAGLSEAAPDTAQGEPLPSDALASLQKVFPSADDFFKERWLMEVRGNTAFAKTLVYGRRAEYHDAAKTTPGGYIWHLDVWSWHLSGSEWKIDRRYIMFRYKQKGGEAVRKLYMLDRLGGVKPGATLEIKAEDLDHGGKFIRNLD